MADRMVVGRIRSPYGVHGWVWMDSFTNDPASVFEWTPWVLKRAPDRVSGRPAIEHIETAPEVWKLRDKRYVAKLVGFPDRTSVESLVNCLIEVDKTIFLNSVMMNFIGVTSKGVALKRSMMWYWAL